MLLWKVKCLGFFFFDRKKKKRREKEKKMGEMRHQELPRFRSQRRLRKNKKKSGFGAYFSLSPKSSLQRCQQASEQRTTTDCLPFQQRIEPIGHGKTMNLLPIHLFKRGLNPIDPLHFWCLKCQAGTTACS